jgi:ribonuclease D
MTEQGITRQEIEKLPLTSYKGRIVLVDHPNSFRRAMPFLKNSKLFGFDTETRPSFRKGHRNKVSLLQLATDEAVFLIRVNLLGIPDPLLRILADPSVIKVGAAVKEDLRRLNEIRRFVPSGFIDLQTIAKSWGIPDLSLRKMAASLLGIRISKSQQLSNWEDRTFTEPQMRYAATDAWVCLQIYQQLVAHE